MLVVVVQNFLFEGCRETRNAICENEQFSQVAAGNLFVILAEAGTTN
jgi:hypothetical protein